MQEDALQHAVEAMRLTNAQLLGIATAAPRARVDVLGSTLLEDLKITGVGSFMSNLTVGAGLTVTGDSEFEANLAVEDLKAVTGVVTSLVGTYSTITTVDIETLDAKDVNITGLAVTDTVGTAATITTIDTEALDAFDAKITGVAVTNAVFTGITTFKDNAQLNFGDNDDLRIYHNGTNSYIDDAGQGNLIIRSNTIDFQKYTGETLANFYSDGKVQLNFDDDKRLETIGTGVSITGQLQAGSLDIGTNAEIHAALTVDHGTVLTGIVTNSAGIRAININVSGILTTNNFRVTGVSTVADITIGAGSSSTKINTNSGELVLDSAAGQVTVQDDLSVIGYGTFRDGIYYRSDQSGINGIGYSGPNGVAYFEADGRLVSGLSTVGFLTTSNYVLTTDANNIPIWSDSIDGGTF